MKKPNQLMRSRNADVVEHENEAENTVETSSVANVQEPVVEPVKEEAPQPKPKPAAKQTPAAIGNTDFTVKIDKRKKAPELKGKATSFYLPQHSLDAIENKLNLLSRDKVKSDVVKAAFAILEAVDDSTFKKLMDIDSPMVRKDFIKENIIK